MAMTPRTYARVTTACLLLSVASAFLFEPSGHLKLLTGSIGLAAGLIAAVAYFRNQWQHQPAQVDIHEQDQESNAISVVLKEDARGISTYADVSTKTMTVVGVELFRGWPDLQTVCELVQHQESDVVARVVEIVQRLSAPENMRAFEFILSREGNFIIRPMMHRYTPLIEDQLGDASEEALPEVETPRPN